MNIKIANIRIDNLCFRMESYGRFEIVNYYKTLSKSGKGRHVEYCYTVAYWERDSEGYQVRFVGDRFMQVEHELFNMFLMMGQKMLNSLYEFEEDQDDPSS